MVSITDLLQQHDEPKEPPPLTKAEKQKLKKLQKKLEKEAKLRKCQEDEMDRETKVAKKNIQNFRTKWKEIGMEKGRPEYDEYMMEHWCLFDHIMDKKDELIETYENELEMAERTRLLTYMDHVRLVDTMLQDYNNILDGIRSEMFTTKCKMLFDRNTNVATFNELTAHEDENMRLVLFLLERKKKEDYVEWGGEFVIAKDEEVMVNCSENELLIARMEVKLMNLWRDYKAILEDYTDYSKKILKRSDVLKDKVKADDQLIIEQKSKIKAMLRTIDGHRLKANVEPLSAELKDLRTERNELFAKYMDEKKRLDEAHNENYQRICHLTNSCNEVKQYLEGVIKKGEQSIALHGLCGKLETRKEHNTKEIQTMKLYGCEYSSANKMIKFWKKVSRVDMVARVMHVQKRKLKKQNFVLKQQMAGVLQSDQLRQILNDVTQCSLQLFNRKE